MIENTIRAAATPPAIIFPVGPLINDAVDSLNSADEPPKLSKTMAMAIAAQTKIGMVLVLSWLGLYSKLAGVLGQVLGSICFTTPFGTHFFTQIDLP